jgi:hypothetical protein
MALTTVDITSALITAGGIFMGVLLTSVINLIQSAATRRTEERKVIYDIASKLAVEQLKLDVERTDAANKLIAENRRQRRSWFSSFHHRRSCAPKRSAEKRSLTRSAIGVFLGR